MKLIKVFIITYQRNHVLNELLESLFSSSFGRLQETETVIINNHSDFHLNPEFVDRVTVLHNMTRPDWSQGNLSENYNQAFINGFRNLKTPDCRYLVTLQNDAVLYPDWVENLMAMHEKYSFVYGECGDNFVSYTSEAVRRIGMWDENFCGVQYKEADYCIRALIHNREGSLINDRLANLYWNAKDWLPTARYDTRNYITANGQFVRKPDDDFHNDMKVYATSNRQWLIAYFKHKWQGTWKQPPEKKGWITDWSDDFVSHPPQVPDSIRTLMRYPYFEADIDDLAGKGYLLP